MYDILLLLSETNAFVKSSTNSVSLFLHWRGGFFLSRGSSGAQCKSLERGWPLLVHSWLPRSERDLQIIYTFKLFVLPASWPCQAKELGSQFTGPSAGAGLLRLQLHAFYGTESVV